MNRKFLPEAELYPLKFTPVCQTRVWGGDQLRSVLHRDIPDSGAPIGESWELSDRDDVNSVVAAGPLAGCTVNELVKHYRTALLGRRCRDLSRFPLLVKLIDAGDRLSLQVHPDAGACARIGRGAEPKTEMWYIISARREARIFAGLKPRATRLQLSALLGSADPAALESQLQVYDSLPRDAYFIPAGTVHAIGAGNLLLEIQQNSDTTYRLSDWGRVDSNGRSRELHVEQGMSAIDFTNRVSPRIAGAVNQTHHNRKFEVITVCPYFHVSDLRLTATWSDCTSNDASFHILSAIDAPVRVVGKNGTDALLEAGESALLPACFGDYAIEPQMAGESTVVKTTL
jgi:mannose-6-phosphate isomerase